MPCEGSSCVLSIDRRPSNRLAWEMLQGMDGCPSVDQHTCKYVGVACKPLDRWHGCARLQEYALTGQASSYAFITTRPAGPGHNQACESIDLCQLHDSIVHCRLCRGKSGSRAAAWVKLQAPGTSRTSPPSQLGLRRSIRVVLVLTCGIWPALILVSSVQVNTSQTTQERPVCK